MSKIDLIALFELDRARMEHIAELHASDDEAEHLACERGGCYHAAACPPDCAVCAKLERDLAVALGESKPGGV